MDCGRPNSLCLGGPCDAMGVRLTQGFPHKIRLCHLEVSGPFWSGATSSCLAGEEVYEKEPCKGCERPSNKRWVTASDVAWIEKTCELWSFVL